MSERESGGKNKNSKLNIASSIGCLIKNRSRNMVALAKFVVLLDSRVCDVASYVGESERQSRFV
jgi:hypothetical protein